MQKCNVFKIKHIVCFIDSSTEYILLEKVKKGIHPYDGCLTLLLQSMIILQPQGGNLCKVEYQSYGVV